MKHSALIVEDNVALAEAFTIVVNEALHYSTVTISDGQEALTHLQGQRPDLLLLDLHLPNVSGQQILDYLTNSTTSAIPTILVITADVVLGQMINEKFSIVSTVLYKPFTLTALANEIRTLTLSQHPSPI